MANKIIKTQKIEDFVAKYIKCGSENLKAQMIKDLVPNKYVPFLQKSAISRAVVAKSMTSKDGVVERNSVSLYLNYVMGMLMLYCPSLELSPDGNFSNYDLLKSTGLLEKIMEEIGDDLSEYMTIYQMETDDFIANQLSIHSYVGSQVTRFSTILGGICKSSFESLANVDSSKVEELINTFIKAVEQ